METIVKDRSQRQKALDVTQSFIVQAPAGSGKTELLTQRFLALLATVKNAPEEVVAITFTRKAATEMRARILNALIYANTHEAPEKSHELSTWKLAKNVLNRDQKSKWNLLNNPNRLRILTIDAMCSRIAKSAPLISHFGSVPQVIEDAERFYKQSAQMLLLSLEEQTPWTNALSNLISHLDNNYSMIENLFVGMLRRRDQWLPYVMTHRNSKDSRIILEQGLKNIILDTLTYSSQFFSADDKTELIELINFAAQMLRNEEKKSFISYCNNLSDFPKNVLEDYPKWLGISELLLTSSFEWRRTVNKNCGFPAASSAINQEDAFLFKHKKERMILLLERFSQNELLRFSLKDILLLPPPQYSDKQWQIVNALIELLPVLVAYLNIIFREKNYTDFIAISEGAIYALGDHENPSDIALNLDYKIQHLLVDEFQDTSVTQLRLLELLTAGWEKNDGRTLFLVGDPMQSIYRFREAEVGIFLRVKNYGINTIKPTLLNLEVNFRSQPGIIDWFNHSFKSIFPEYENLELGAIPFYPSSAFIEETPTTQNVIVHPIFNAQENEEANYIIELIKNLTLKNPEKSIAILVRSRGHLKNIIPALKKSNIVFQAVEIEKLIHSPVIQDLFALTKALTHLGDRVAWLALLRAPWCGLNLTDLYLIANHNLNTTLWKSLQDYQKIEGLSDEAKKRILRILPVFNDALNNRSRINLREWVGHVWHSLGGPACLDELYEIEHATAYLNILDQFTDDTIIDINHLEERLFKTYNHSSHPDAKVHLMTIHKAKGLEFDIVIIPGLEKKPAVEENHLLVWTERQNNNGEIDLILAPIKSSQEDTDSIYKYIRNQSALKLQFEVSRLLYVAVTRAKENLHLIGNIDYLSDKDEFKNPLKGSFLHLLWPSVQSIYKNKFEERPTVEISEISESKICLQRHTLDWERPEILTFSEESTPSLANNAFNWNSTYLNYTGTLIHQILQDLSHSEKINETILCENQKIRWQKKLLQLGVADKDLSEAMLHVEKAVRNILQDQRSDWILSNKHIEAKSEFSITFYQNNEIIHYIIDRTFIDEHGTRWIIDYKTSELSEEDKTFFLLKAKMRYCAQLENYARAMATLDGRRIKLGLYFPLFSGWCEWDYIQ